MLVAADQEELVGYLILGPWVALESAAHVAEVRGGFEAEGTHREAFLLEGAYVDDLLMALDLT